MSALPALAQCSHFSSSGTNEAAEIGTALHEIMDEAINHYQAEGGTLRQSLAHVLDLRGTVEEQDRHTLYFCTREIEKYLYRPGCKIRNEIRVSLTSDKGEKLNYGHLDLLLEFTKTDGRKVGVLIDYKFGWLPVTPAPKNLQGIGYAVGCFQAFPMLDAISSVFIQPRLSVVSSVNLFRSRLPEYLTVLQDVIERAKVAQEAPLSEEAYSLMRVGGYCSYCDKKPKCSKVAEHIALYASGVTRLPIPVSWKVAQVNDPAEIALLKAWSDLIEPALDDISKRAFELAEASGGFIEARLPDGTLARYEVQEKNCDRVVGEASLVAEALQSIVLPEQILGAAKLSIGKLMDAVVPVIQEIARSNGEKLTKKAAIKQIESILETEGLLSRPDTKVRFLKRKKETEDGQTKEN
jgi:hypothetical protein